MIDDNETFVRAVEKAHDELGLTYKEIAGHLGMSDSNLWAIRTQGRSQRATAGVKAVLDQFYAERGSTAIVVVGGWIQGELKGRKVEVTGYWDPQLIHEMEDDLENIVLGDLEAETIGGWYDTMLVRTAYEAIPPSVGRILDMEAAYNASAFTEAGMDLIDS